ncbi:hypothetical protein HS048_36440 [Planomonospora sp. ID91781]|uniref:hypothetical protein n=1 Tax=Planomonospora sp. ID91781 TaxID=2738135 RepID=UPI0018C3D828|nr:hypothetical protein [Planomonospora sp. ID91781]MBG0826158.1 hypothetical protein [Planomonospora sp. ID91781]
MRIRFAAALALLPLAGIAACGAAPANSVEQAPAAAPAVSSSPSWEAVPGTEGVVAEEETPEEPQYTPQSSDFKVDIRVMKKECFGSAGCHITYRIKPSYNGLLLSADQEYTVTYEVIGGDDSHINSFTITGDEMSFASEETISTPSSSSKLRAKVTDVF